MPVLSSNDVHALRELGIEVEKDVHGTIYSFTASSLFFLLNYLYIQPIAARRKQLSATLLRNLVAASPVADPRSVSIKCISLPAHSSTYYSLFIYLVGTPIRMRVITEPVTDLSTHLSLNVYPLPSANERAQSCMILKPEEIRSLLDGEVLTFKPE